MALDANEFIADGGEWEGEDVTESLCSTRHSNLGGLFSSVCFCGQQHHQQHHHCPSYSSPLLYLVVILSCVCVFLSSSLVNICSETETERSFVVSFAFLTVLDGSLEPQGAPSSSQFHSVSIF